MENEKREEQKKKRIRKALLKKIGVLAALVIVTGAVLTAIGFGIAAIVQANGVKKALDSSRYRYVQIEKLEKRQQILSSLQQESSETDDIEETESEDGGAVIDDVLGEESTVEEGTTVLETSVTMKKSGDIIYEEGMLGSTYYYYNDAGEYCALWKATEYQDGELKEIWTEDLAERYYEPMFDVSVLDTISSKELKKDGKYYVPSGEADEFFFKLFGIQSTSYYEDISIKLSFKNGRLNEIVTDYIFDESVILTSTYQFSYKVEKINVPKPEISYVETDK